MASEQVGDVGIWYSGHIHIDEYRRNVAED